MNPKALIAIILAVVVVGGGIYYVKSRSNTAYAPTAYPSPSATSQVTSVSPSPVASPAMETSSPTAAQPGTTKAFTVAAANFSYDKKEIRVKKGDTVSITLANTEGMHNLVIDEFNVSTPVISAAREATVSFTADKVGSFVYYCSVGQHRQMGMWGTLIVE